MSTIKTLEFTKQVRLVRKNSEDAAGTIETNNKTKGKGQNIIPNVPVKDDWEYNIDVKDCMSKKKVFRDQELAWKENKAKCYYYYLVLFHCLKLKELGQELKNSTKWGETESN